MKKRVLLSLSALVLVSAPLLAQDGKKPMNCTGTISDDGLSFTCDKDHKVWKVSNPAALQDMEGHYAKLTFRRTSNADEVLVTSASVVQQTPTTVAHNPGNGAFQP